MISTNNMERVATSPDVTWHLVIVVGIVAIVAIVAIATHAWIKARINREGVEMESRPK